MKETSEKEIIQKIEVMKVDFDILTAFSVDCNEYEERWSDILSKCVIENKDTINLFISIIDKLEKDTAHYDLDVRAKLLLFNQFNQIDTICMNRYIVSKSGCFYRTNKRLVEMVEKL